MIAVEWEGELELPAACYSLHLLTPAVQLAEIQSSFATKFEVCQDPVLCKRLLANQNIRVLSLSPCFSAALPAMFPLLCAKEWMRVCSRCLIHLLQKMMPFNDILPLRFWMQTFVEYQTNIISKTGYSSVSLTRPCSNGDEMAVSNETICVHEHNNWMLAQCGPSSSWLGKSLSSRVCNQKQSTQTCSTRGSTRFSVLPYWNSLHFTNIEESIWHLSIIHSSWKLSYISLNECIS